MNRRLNHSGNAVAFETTLQFRGITDIIVLAGSTVGIVSPGKFDGNDKIVFDFVPIVFVVLAFKVLSPVNSSTPSSPLVILGCRCKNFSICRIDLFIDLSFELILSCSVLQIDSACLFV